MSLCRRDAFIEAPVGRVWALVGDPAQHPSWWPRVVEVRGESFEQDSRYAQVTRNAFGANQETTLMVDRNEELREFGMHCLDTGMFCRWQLTEARGQTFVALELGMQPTSPLLKMFDATWGRIYFSRWAEQAVDGLRRAAE
jgi:uncharacterized protein YndB with AHSA1/START domain